MVGHAAARLKGQGSVAMSRQNSRGRPRGIARSPLASPILTSRDNWNLIR